MSSSILYDPFSFPTILVSMLIRVIHEITFLFTNMTFASLQRVDQGNSNVFRVSAIYVVWGLATPYNDLFYTIQKRFAGLNKRVCVKHLLLCCYQSGPFFVWFILNLYNMKVPCHTNFIIKSSHLANYFLRIHSFFYVFLQ